MEHALAVLEWPKVLEQLAGHCETQPGELLAAALLPETEPVSVMARLEETSEASRLYQSSLPSLRGVRDVASQVEVAAKGGALGAEVLAQVGKALVVMQGCRKSLLESDAHRLKDFAGELPDLPKLAHRLETSVDVDGVVLDTASPALAAARGKIKQAEARILERIQRYVSRSRDLLSDPIFTERNGRFVIPLKAENRGKIKGIVHDSSASGQTIYLEPEDVVALGNSLREAEAAERAEVDRVLKELSAEVGAQAEVIVPGFAATARLDLIFAKAKLGAQQRGCEARPLPGARIRIAGGRHPLLSSESAVPLSVTLGEEADAILITGPNTGGKTIAIKSVGLFVAMAQSGMMLPAQDVAIGCFTQIWADIGDEQSLAQSLSTFSAHIKNISDALKSMRKDALVLLDEVGAGTDPDEGAALAQALLQAFLAKGAKILASTHYGELKVFAGSAPGFMNASMEFDVKTLRPTYKFLPGTPGSSHAFKIAARYGIPQTVLDQAQAGFSTQEQDVAKMIGQLESAQRRAQAAQSEADRLAARLRKVEAEAEEKIRRAEESRNRLGQRAADELDELLRQIRIEAEETFAEVKRGGTQEAIDQARMKLRGLQESGSDLSQSVRPKQAAPVAAAGQIELGAKVQYPALGFIGVVTSPVKNGKVTVQGKTSRMDLAVKDLVLLAPPEPVKAPKAKSSKLRLEKATQLKRELHLRHMRAEDALEALEKCIDDALVAGADMVRIVHGKGEGVLRKVTQDFLRRHPHVASFTDGEADDGGQGVTVARLE